MGLDQWILRTTGDEPVMNDNGGWINATECIQLRKEYWLKHRVDDLVKERYGKKSDEYCCEYIPLSKEDLNDIIEDTKHCVREKDEIETSRMFHLGLFYSNHDFDWCIEGMRYFNRIMCNRLRSQKENQYWYLESW